MSKRKSHPASHSLGDIHRLIRVIAILLNDYRADVTYIPSKGAVSQFQLLHQQLANMAGMSRELQQNMEHRHRIGHWQSYRQSQKGVKAKRSA